MNGPHFYGQFDSTRYDLRGLRSLSVDLRPLMGCPGAVDQTTVAPAGAFRLSVHGVAAPGGLYVGEIIMWIRGKQVHMVGALTGRNVMEVTPDHLRACRVAGYAGDLRGWLGIVR